MLLRGEIYIGVFLSETVAVKERVKQNVVEQPRLPWIQLEWVRSGTNTVTSHVQPLTRIIFERPRH